MSLRWFQLTTIALVFAGIFYAPTASAWTEWHEHANNVRLETDRQGTVQVQHSLRYRVVMGPLKFVDLIEVDPAAVPVSEGEIIVGEGEAKVPAHVEFLPIDPKSPVGKRTLRATVDDPKGLPRGKYTFLIRYALPIANLLVRDGALLRLKWTQPPSPEGSDSAKITFVVPSAPTEPRIDADNSTWMMTQSRMPATDEVVLERAHITKGEAAEVALRIDPRALGESVKVERKPLAPVPLPAETRLPLALAALVCALTAAAIFFALRWHAIRTGFAPPTVRAPVAAVGMAIATAALVSTTLGGGLAPVLQCTLLVQTVALAAVIVACAAARLHPNAASTKPSRGWLPLRADEAFADTAQPLPWSRLQFGRAARSLVIVAVFTLFGALAWRFASPDAALTVAAMGAPFLLLACMDGPHGTLARRRAVLAEIVAALGERASTLRTTPLARLDSAGIATDLRLRLAPRSPLAGLAAIELGFAASTTQLALVIRTRESTPAEKRVRAMMPGASSVGRAEGERVVVLEPKVPLRESLYELCEFVARALEERRKAPKLFRGKERRSFAALAVARAV